MPPEEQTPQQPTVPAEPVAEETPPAHEAPVTPPETTEEPSQSVEPTPEPEPVPGPVVEVPEPEAPAHEPLPEPVAPPAETPPPPEPEPPKQPQSAPPAPEEPKPAIEPAPVVTPPVDLGGIPAAVLALTDEELKIAAAYYLRKNQQTIAQKGVAARQQTMNQRMDEIVAHVQGGTDKLHRIAKLANLSPGLTSHYLQILIKQGRIKAEGHGTTRRYFV